jgi:hypothetical protein
MPCFCPDCTENIRKHFEDDVDPVDHVEGRLCSECKEAREAEIDREFDEKVALGYFV